jgi:hypothetical protein
MTEAAGPRPFTGADELIYSTLKPEGIPSRMVQVRYKPATTQTINPGDSVSFLINSAGFLDPQTTFINIEVDFSNLADHVIAQIDGSALSFFRSMVINCRGTELERIHELDVLSNILTSAKISNNRKFLHTYEGSGMSNFFADSHFCKMENGVGISKTRVSLRPTLSYNDAYISSGATTYFLNTSSLPQVNASVQTVISYKEPFVVSGGSSQPILYTSNWGYSPFSDTKPFNYTMGASIETANSGLFGRDKYQSLNSKLTWSSNPSMSDLSWVWTNVTSYSKAKIHQRLGAGIGNCIVAHHPNIPLKVAAGNYYFPESLDPRLDIVENVEMGTGQCWEVNKNVGRNYFALYGRDGIEVITDADIVTGTTCKQMTNSSLSNNTAEPVFTNGKIAWWLPLTDIPVKQQMPTDENTIYLFPGVSPPAGYIKVTDIFMRYERPSFAAGVFDRIPISKALFSVPLPSGLIGALMPENAYKLIPLRAFPNLSIEFIISQYPIFTSGFCNSNANSQTNQPSRNFMITSMELVTTQYVFSPDTENAILANYNSGQTLYIHSHSFVLGPPMVIQANQIPGSIQINYGFDSLKAVLIAFIPLDFVNFSWCRKQYRISMNITKIQLKIGLDYIPPIGGFANGGNVNVLNGQSNLYWRRPNNEHLIELQKCFGFYDDTNAASGINAINFAPNGRPYAPDNDSSKTTTSTDSMGYSYQACFCQYGWPLWHENRCKAECVYGIDTESLQKSTMLSGVNTINNKPFDLILEYESDAGAVFPRNAQMYIFLWFDFVCSFNRDGLSIVGKS